MKKLKLESKKVKVLTKNLGNYLVIEWRDPSTHVREKLSEIMKEPLALVKTSGELILVTKKITVLRHEVSDDEIDATVIPTSLITGVYVI